MTVAAGTKLGPYEILAPIGAGGMGEVYRARDTKLDRDVAVKVLPDRVAADSEALSRFEREAKAVAAVSHPNVLAIYDFAADRDITYIVTELLEGESLRQRLQQSPIPWRKAVEVGASVADGLAAAHARGIIHRDLKPENIFLTADGVVKILDFGLARVQHVPGPDDRTMTLDTKPGTVLGTVNYMSPEQVRGRPLDARTDIFSLGCVLYEMITGERAFKGGTSADITTAILTRDPATVSATVIDVAPDVDRTIARCLEKKSQQRFQSSGDLAFTLRSILSGTGSSIASTSGQGAGGWKWAVGVLAVMLVVAAGFITRSILSPDQPGERIDSLLVLPFLEQSGETDAEFLGEGIAESVINSLLTMPDLRVIPRNTAVRYKGREHELDEIALELDVRAVLTGRVHELGGRLIVRASLEDTKYQRQIWGEEYDRPRSDILAIERDIARRISDALRLQLSGEDVARRDKQFTDNPEAYMAYAQGRFWWSKRTEAGFRRAIGLYDEAISIDPSYALAYAGKADCFALAGWYFQPARETMPQAKEAIDAALALDPLLSEAYATRAWVRYAFDWDWAGAERDFRRAIELNPDYATAHHWYSIFLTAQGRLDKAQREIRRALELDPGSLIINRGLSGPYFFRRQYDRAIEQYRNTLGMDPTFVQARVTLASALNANHQYDEAIAEIQRVHEEAGRFPRAAGWLAVFYAAAGHLELARQELQTLTALSERQYVPAVAFALIHAELGEYDDAFARMNEAFEARDGALAFLVVSPWFDALRADPRFDDLLRRVGLEGVKPTRPAPPLPLKPKTGRINLVVLPFKDISPTPEAWFADGLTETLIAQLSRLSPDKLSVIASTTAMQYKGTDKRIRQIGRELDLDYVVEGRVQRIDDRVRIFAGLVRAGDETHIWSQDYDRKIDDVFALQSEVAGRIAEGIQIKLTPAQEAQLGRARPLDPDALDAYLQGIALAKDGTEQACRSALTMFDQAIEVDPSFALAHVGRADVFVTLGEWHVLPVEAMPYAKAAALDALALDAGLPEALTALAFVQLEFEWDFPAAEETFRHAMKLNGSSTDARLGYAQYLTAMKRGDEAIGQLDWVREHDPASVYTYEHHGMVAFMARRFDRVIRDCSAAINVDPEFWKARTWLGLAHAQRGQFAEGIHHLRKALTQSDDSPVVAAMLGSVLALSGENEEAREIVEALKENERDEYVCPYELATIWIGLKDHDAAFAEMDRACDGQAVCMPWLQADPRLDPIRPDPRFGRLVRRVGFEQDGKLRLAEAVEPDHITLAVLPFEPASANQDTEYLKGEIPASIIHTLSTLSGLQVIPRSTAFRYRVEDKDTATIGRDLGATAVLTGRINTRGDTLIIRAELVDVVTKRQLWDGRYDRKLTDIMAIEEDIAKEISEALRLQLTGEERAQLTRRHTENAEAYKYYLKGRFWWNKRNQRAIDKAIVLFIEAVRIDPQYALAYAGLADSYCVLGWAYRRPSDVFPKAREAAEQALAIDPGLAEAYPALGFVGASYDWDLSGAAQAFERAFELDPRYSHAHQWYALVLARTGRLDEMLRQARRGQELDPGSLMASWGVGMAHYVRREYAAAAEQLNRTLEMEPNFGPARQMLGLVYVRMKRYEDAIGVYRGLHELGGRVPANAGQLGLAYALAGRRGEALEELRILEDVAKERYIPPTAFALIHGGLGDMDEAFRWMNRAVEQRDCFLSLLGVSPTFDELRGDPRFDVLLRRIGLPPSAPNGAGSSSERPE